MASYCDVCQGLYFTPHPHLLPQRRSLSCPPQRPTRQATPSHSRHFPEHASSPCAAERSRTPLSCGLTASSFSPSFGAPRAGTPLPRRRRASGNSGSRGHGCAADSSALAFPLSGAGVQGSAPPAASARKGRSFTPPALPLSPSHDRDGSAGDDGAAALAVTPSRLRGRRYSTDTFSRLRHTDGVAAQCDFLRCGEGVVGSRHPSGPPSRTSPTHWSPLPPSSFFCDSRYPQREQEEAEYCYVDPHPVRELRRGEEEDGEEEEREWQSAQRAWPEERMTSGYDVPHRAGRKAPTDAYDTRSHSRHPSGNGGQSHSRHHLHRHRDVSSSSSSCSSGGDRAPREYRSRHHHRRRRHSSRRMGAPRSGHLPAVQSTEQGSSGQGVPDPSSLSLLQPTSSPPLIEAGTASLAGDKQMPPLRNQQQQPQPQHQTDDTTADHPAAATAAVSPQLPPDTLGQLMAQIRAEVRKDGAAWLEAQCKKDGGDNSASMSENNDSDDCGGDSAESRALVAAVLRKVSRTGESKSARTATTKREAAAAAVTVVAKAGEEERNAAPSLSTSAAPVASTAGSTADAEVDSAASTAEEREGGRRRGQPAVPAQPRHQVHDTAVTEQRPKEREKDELQKDSSEHSHTKAVKTASAKARQQYSPPSPPPPPFAATAAARTRTASSPCLVRPSSSSSSSSSRASSSCRSEGSRSASAKQLQRVVAEAEAALEKMRQHRSERKASSQRRTPQPVVTGAEEERKESRETETQPSSRRDTRQRRENEEAERLLPAEALQSIAAALEGKLEHQQEAWCTAQAHRIERLREGLSSLCSAVHKDLRKMRAEVDAARETADSAKADVVAAAAAMKAGVRTQPIPSPKPQSDADRVAALPPSCVLTWVSQCSREEQRRLAHLLLPHLRPELSDVIAAEVQRQLGEREAEQQQRLRDTETRLHAVVEEAVSTAQAAQSSHRQTLPSAAAPLWAAFSSADAFDAHLRSTARAVLLEEDDRRYSLANDNERRHEMRTRELQRHWEATLHDAQHAWRAEWRTMLAETQEGWLRKAQAPLQKHSDVLQDVVTALTRDVTHLQAQLNTQAASLQTAMQTEREMRQREHAKTTELVESRVRAWLPREVEAACVRHHTQREQSAATAAAAGSPPSLHTSRSQHSAEELRLSVVQPALDHMRRLLASHQELVNASVEDRCTRAESVVEGSRHMWLQNVTELRGKVSALRSDVRGAFHELCDGLNVASPAL